MIDTRYRLFLLAGSALAIAACESIDGPVLSTRSDAYDLPEPPREVATYQAPAARATATSPDAGPGAATQASSPAATPVRPSSTPSQANAGGVPQAPYSSTPQYQSQYSDYWRSTQDLDDPLARAQAQRDGLIVTDPSSAAPVPAPQPSGSQYTGTAGSRTAPGSGTYTGGSAAPRYDDYGSRAPATTTQATTTQGYVSGSSSADAMDEIPPAPETLPARSAPRYVTEDGQPYPEELLDESRRIETGAAPSGAPAAMPVRPQTSVPAAQPIEGRAAASAVAPASVAAPTVMSGGEAVSGGYALHLASYRLLDNAYAGWGVLQARHSGVLSGLTPVVSADDIPGLGLHYRLKAGPLTSQQEALALCNAIKAGGDYCAVMGYSGQAF